MSVKIKLLISLCFFLPGMAYSQAIISGKGADTALPERFVLEVKQLGQFMGRFNNEEDVYGNLYPEENTELRPQRQKVLATLFNQALLADTTFRREANEFINMIAMSSKTLNFYDKDWYSTVECKIIYKSQPKRLILTLINEGDYSSGSKWVITGAKADFLQVSQEKQEDRPNIIPPSNHELNFLDLIRVFNSDYTNINDYVDKDYQPCNLDMLFSAIRNGEIKMQAVTKTTYHFLQIPGWIFTVDFYNRASGNSGWLISSLQKAGSEEISRYRQTTLYLKH
jgi:hypothetical protein